MTDSTASTATVYEGGTPRRVLATCDRCVIEIFEETLDDLVVTRSGFHYCDDCWRELLSRVRSSKVQRGLESAKRVWYGPRGIGWGYYCGGTLIWDLRN